MVGILLQEVWSKVLEHRKIRIPHPDFVYLDDVDSSILQDIRYARSDNFTSWPLAGYLSPVAILRLPVAEALKAAQQGFLKLGFTLVVLDAYRPQRAVNMMVEWAERTDPSLIKDDYISKTSHHSRGIAVDVTLARVSPLKSKPNRYMVLDMGSAFDDFNERSHTQTYGIREEQQMLRNFLVDVMQAHGFNNYRREWWHFTYVAQRFPNVRFDFPIRG